MGFCGRLGFAAPYFVGDFNGLWSAYACHCYASGAWGCRYCANSHGFILLQKLKRHLDSMICCMLSGRFWKKSCPVTLSTESMLTAAACMPPATLPLGIMKPIPLGGFANGAAIILKYRFGTATPVLPMYSSGKSVSIGPAMMIMALSAIAHIRHFSSSFFHVPPLSE